MKSKILVIANSPFDYFEPFVILSEYEITSSFSIERTQNYLQGLDLIVVEIDEENQYEVILWFMEKVAHLKIPMLFWFDGVGHSRIIKTLKLEFPDNEIGSFLKDGSKYNLANGVVKFLESIKK